MLTLVNLSKIIFFAGSDESVTPEKRRRCSLNHPSVLSLGSPQTETMSPRHGGESVAEVLRAHGIKYVFTLVGGHISPILVACEKMGIRIVDTRHEATAVFAADAVARLSGADSHEPKKPPKTFHCDESNTSNGVPQMLVLGPLLQINNDGAFVFYADDVVIYCACFSISSAFLFFFCKTSIRKQ